MRILKIQHGACNFYLILKCISPVLLIFKNMSLNTIYIIYDTI